MHTPILGFRRFIWHDPVLNIHEQCAIFDLNVFQTIMIYPFSYFETPFVDHLHMELTYFLIYVIIFFLYKSYIEGEIMMISKRQQPVFCHCVKYFLMVLFIIFFMSFHRLTWGQRSLGFKGLVPPPNAKQKKISGKVVLSDLPLIKIKNIWGTSKVFIGPPRFLRDQGFLIRNGQELEILAVPVKVEGREIFVAFQVEDAETGRKIFLRDHKGEPIWWGGNPRSGSESQSRPGAKTD